MVSTNGLSIPNSTWFNPWFLVGFNPILKKPAASPSLRPNVCPSVQEAVTAHSPPGITVHPKTDKLLGATPRAARGPNDVEIPLETILSSVG